MARLLLLTSNPQTYTHKSLLEEAQKLNYHLDFINTRSFVGLPQTTNYDLVINRSSSIYFDDTDLLLSFYLKEQGIRVLGDPDILTELRGKDKQFIFFLKHQLPHIPSLLTRGKVENEQLSSLKGDEFILKTTRGNQGLGVMFLKGRDSLLSVLETNHLQRNEHYLLQPRLSFTSEYRLLILKDEVIGCLEKKAQDDFRLNAKRATSLKLPFSKSPKPVQELANKLIEILPQQFFALDIGLTEKEALIIEVNTNPGFEDYDRLYQTKCAEKLLRNYL